MAIRFPRNCLLMMYLSTVLIVDKTYYRTKVFLFMIGIVIALSMGRLDLYVPILIDNVDLFMNQNYLFEYLYMICE